MFIPCQNCGKQYDDSYSWYVCDMCGYRICTSCFGSHSGQWNGYVSGGYKCSQCQIGTLHLHNGIKEPCNSSRPVSKLDEYLSRIRGVKTEPAHLHVKETPSAVESTHDDLCMNRCSDKTSDGIILTNSRLIACKYKNCTIQDVQELVRSFIARS